MDRRELAGIMDEHMRKRLLAVDVLLELPDEISDVLKSELHALRDRLQAIALA